MTIAIMQPYFFPYIGYFQAIKAVDKYIIYDDLNYIYQGWVDRNRLVDKRGQIFYIRPQLEGASVSKLISEIKFQQKQFWKNKLIKTLELSYAGAKHFEETMILIKEILEYDTMYLCDFNFNLIKKISTHLNLNTIIEKADNYYKSLELQLRANEKELNQLFPDFMKKNMEIKVIRAIKICEYEKANVFINAIGGTELYDKSVFKEYGVDLKFIQSDSITYKQFSQNHFPYLSIIDVLMHNGKENTKALLNQYQLI